MFRYIKAAFWVRPNLAGLGGIPINALGFGCLAILGFGNPGFWLLGLGLELAFLLLLSTNARFQTLVDARDNYQSLDQAETTRQELIARLDPSARRRLGDLEAKCGRILDVYRDSQSDHFLVDANSDALRKLCWLYLKLLISRHNLQSAELQTSSEGLKRAISGVDQELQQAGITDSLRESKIATREILRKRLDNLQRREQTLAEIDSDLTRIEAQADLALENASLQNRPSAISTNIDLASDLLEGGFYGDSESAVNELDAAFLRSPGSVKQ